MMRNLPLKLHKYYSEPGNFITYYGDIYSGRFVSCPGYDDRLFIIQNDKTNELQKLKQEDRTIDWYRKMAWEIRDINIIRHDTLQTDPDYQNTPNPKTKSKSNHQNFKKWFVFGAGASAYCVSSKYKDAFRDSPLSPPECYEIFGKKYDTFCSKYDGVTQSSSTIDAFLSDKSKNIEDYFENEWKTYRHSYNPSLSIRHLNIQYYLQELFSEISLYGIKQFRGNLYSAFANKLQQYLASNTEERVGIISFNYDTILDHFINSILEKKLNTMDNYWNWDYNTVAFFKPHGSHNWGWRFRDDRIGICDKASISNFLFDNKIEPYQIYYHYLGDVTEMLGMWGHEYHLSDNFVGRFTPNKNRISVIPQNTVNPYLPTLLLPYRDKDEFLMPYDHYYAMDFILPDAEEIYLIGWKGNEKLFNKELKKKINKNCKIIIVNPKPDEVKLNLINAGIKITDENTSVIEDFEKFINTEIDNVFPQHLD